MEIDPKEFNTCGRFKRAFYEKHGIGSWLDDLKLTIIYRKANGIELDSYMKELLKGD